MCFQEPEVNHFPSKLLTSSYFVSTVSSPILHHRLDQENAEPNLDIYEGFADPWECTEDSGTDSISCSGSSKASPQKIPKKRGRKVGSFRKTPKILKNFVSLKIKKLSLREKITLSVKENSSATDRTLSVFIPEIQPGPAKKYPLRRKRSYSDFSSLLCSNSIVKTKKAIRKQNKKSPIVARKSPKSSRKIQQEESLSDMAGAHQRPSLIDIVQAAKSKLGFNCLDSLRATLQRMKDCSAPSSCAESK